jgi:hypothetical protein
MKQQHPAAIPLTALERDQLELRAIGQVGEATFYTTSLLLARYNGDSTLYHIADQRVRTYIDQIGGIEAELERTHKRIAQLEAEKARLEHYARAPFVHERGI